MIKEKYQEIFKDELQDGLIQEIFSPGRVNIIGEHIDYNGGFVFPVAINLGTTIVFQKRNDSLVHVFSENFSEDRICVWNIDEPMVKKASRWDNFVKGMVAIFKAHDHELSYGFNAYVSGNIPHGAGLSSSASLEVGFGLLLEIVSDIKLPMLTIVKYAQEAENKFIGLQCGIMDMFAVGKGKRDQAMLLNTEDLSCTYTPFKLTDHILLVMDTKKVRKLEDSKYNERYAECQEALQQLQEFFGISTLCELHPTELKQVSKELAHSPLLYKRVQHLVTEQARVLKVFEAMKIDDLATVGACLNASHASLRDYYQVTGKELDTIVSAAQEQTGVIGSRMTGAGFGGCAIAIVEKTKVATVIAAVERQYRAVIGTIPAFYQVSIVDGTKLMEEGKL